MLGRWCRRNSRDEEAHETESGPSAGLKAVAEAEGALRSAIHAAYIEVSKAQLERVQRAADFVTTVAAGVGTIYTGLLALVYSTKEPVNPLPARGIAPGVFLALAFFFGVVNVGFVRASTKNVHILRAADTWDEQQLRLVEFMQWIGRGGQIRRAWALRVAVVCLGGAVALLPLPFVSLSRTATLTMIVLVGGATAAYLFYELFSIRRSRGAEEPRGEAEQADAKPEVRDPLSDY
jgi:hypothetical protein